MKRILILDVPVSDTAHEQFMQFGCFPLDAREMSEKLRLWEGWNVFPRETTLLVFPGNGANIVRRFLGEEWLSSWRWASVFAKRFWQPGEDPHAIVGRIVPDRMILGMRSVVVVDDVVSSGATCRALREMNAPWMPGATWHSVSWVKQRSASLKGFSTSFATEEAGEKMRKVPINSLSTLLQDEAIAVSYAKRHLQEADRFLEILNSLRNAQISTW